MEELCSKMDRTSLLRLSSACEKSKRWDEMFTAMSFLVKFHSDTSELSEEERTLLSVSSKAKVDGIRVGLRSLVSVNKVTNLYKEYLTLELKKV